MSVGKSALRHQHADHGQHGVDDKHAIRGRSRSPTMLDTRRPGLLCEGMRDVIGFEAQQLRVARCKKKMPKTQSWCFVPLIFSALGRVPDRLIGVDISTDEQIAAAQPVWEQLFSHWREWRHALQRAIEEQVGIAKFEQEFLPRHAPGKGWTTSLVFKEPRTFGKLPHPAAGRQDAILKLLPADTQNQIFASVFTIAN